MEDWQGNPLDTQWNQNLIRADEFMTKAKGAKTDLAIKFALISIGESLLALTKLLGSSITEHGQLMVSATTHPREDW